jgi:hypothetical protein
MSWRTGCSGAERVQRVLAEDSLVDPVWHSRGREPCRLDLLDDDRQAEHSAVAEHQPTLLTNAESDDGQRENAEIAA